MQENAVRLSLHDGCLVGVMVEDDTQATLQVKDIAGVAHNIVLKGVEKLKINDFREGNIILSIEFGMSLVTDNALIEDLLDINSDEMRCSGYYNEYIDKIVNGKLQLFLLTPSYGATVMSICKDVVFIP